MAPKCTSSGVLFAHLFVASFVLHTSNAQQLVLYYKFDEGQGSSLFSDASGHSKDGNCRLSGASCPRTGSPAKVSSSSAFFAASCPRAYGSSVDDCDYSGRSHTLDNLSPGQRTDCYFNRAKQLEFRRKYYSLAATCGSAVAFSPVQFTDGTVMLWYKEFSPNDGNPQQLFNPLANHAVNPTDSTILRNPADLGWDLSLVGGNEFSLGRIGSVHWGGYWCGKWHIARSNTGVGQGLSPGYTSGDSLRGWDHLAWHHLAYVFAGSTAVIYLDGQPIVMFPNAGQCAKEASFVGKRTIRFDNQGGAREIEWTDSNNRAWNPADGGSVNPMDGLKSKEWATNYFKGYIDELKIYNAPLDQGAIAKAMTP